MHTDSFFSARFSSSEKLIPEPFELFSEIFGAYWLDDSAAKGAVSRNVFCGGSPGEVFAKYAFASRHPSWKLTVNGTLYQRSVCKGDFWLILTYDLSHQQTREEAYSLSSGEWVYTRYFTGKEISAELLPTDRKSVLLKEHNVLSAAVSEKEFFPCKDLDTANELLCARVSEAVGAPQVSVQTAAGTLFCYPADMLAQVTECIGRQNGNTDGQQIPTAEEALLATLIETQKPSAAQPTETPAQELPNFHELFAEPEKSAEEPKAEDETDAEAPIPAEVPSATEPEMPAESNAVQMHSAEGALLFESENETRQISYTEEGFLRFAGALKNGEANGFGIHAEEEQHRIFVGQHLCGAVQGISLSWEDTQGCTVQYNDSFNPEAADTVLFSAEGTVRFAGNREGFGTVLLSDNEHFCGQWKNGLPNGNGVLLDASGLLRYNGQWKNGKRSGFGTAYENGRICYIGEWAEDRCHGEGTLLPEDGTRICGTFANGSPNGTVKAYRADGTLCYEGEIAQQLYEGNGIYHRTDGTRICGIFAKGQPVAPAEHRAADGTLLYRGGFENGEYSGRGTLYRDGVAVYEGNFVHGIFSGSGKLLAENGDTVYAGNFTDGHRCGVGASFNGDAPIYFGQWANDLPNGCGMRYENGVPKFVGVFADGRMQGRIDQYDPSGVLRRELFCEQDVPTYAVEYDAFGKPIYTGAIHHDLPNGMGRQLNDFGECLAQGLFQNGDLVRQTQVILRDFPPLPCPEALLGTNYATLAQRSSRFVLDMPIKGGLYSGHLRGGLPNGNGSLLYPGHRCTAAFENGQPVGEGTLCLSTGETIRVCFVSEPDAEVLQSDGCTYTFRRLSADTEANE